MWWFRKKDDVESWIAKLKKKNPGAHREAAETLGELGDTRAVESLIQALRDVEGGVRWRVAEALGKIGDVQAVEPLVQALKDTDRWVRGNAADALGELGDTRAVEPLIQALRDMNKWVRVGAAEALRKIGDARSVEPLIQVLGDTEKEVQWRAAEALGEIEGIRAIEPLSQVLGRMDGWVRESVMEVLHKVCASIHIILFGHGTFNGVNQSITWLNPDVSDLTIPLSKLERIVIYPETYDFYQIERFITYAVNYIGQKYLKEHVEVQIYGDPDKLHPNLRNSLENLCKSVEVNDYQ